MPSSSVTAPASAQLGPGASYYASGSWHFIVRDKPNGDVMDEGDNTLIQDADGNIHIANGPTFTRVGTGQAIAYSVSSIEHHQNCDTNLSGQAQLDTKTNTFHAHVSGIEAELNCSQVNFWLTATKDRTRRGPF